MPSWSTAKVKLTELNPHLICALCGGYFIDATTITECLHTFCKTCIVRYLESSKYCPVCDVMVHKTKPLLHIRSDHVLQALVYKMVPGLFTREITKRKRFYADSAPTGSEVPDEDALEESMLGSNHRTTDILDHYSKNGAEKEKISVSLQFSPNGRPIDEYEFTCGSSDNEFEDEEITQTRYLLCPAAFSVHHLKKFLRMKFDLDESFSIDVFHIDEPLCDRYTLMDIAYIYAWRRLGPLRLFYSVYQNPAKRRKRSHTASQPVSPAEEEDKSLGAKAVSEEVKKMEASERQALSLSQAAPPSKEAETSHEMEKVPERLDQVEECVEGAVASEDIKGTKERKHKKGHSKNKGHKRSKKDKSKERRKKKKKSKKNQSNPNKHKSHKSSRKRKELESICDLPTKCSKLSPDVGGRSVHDVCLAFTEPSTSSEGTLKFPDEVVGKEKHKRGRKNKDKKSKNKTEKHRNKERHERQPILLKLHKETYQLAVKTSASEGQCFQRKDAQELMKNMDLKRDLFKPCASELASKCSEKAPAPPLDKSVPPEKGGVAENPPLQNVPSEDKKSLSGEELIGKTVKVLVPKELHKTEDKSLSKLVPNSDSHVEELTNGKGAKDASNSSTPPSPCGVTRKDASSPKSPKSSKSSPSPSPAHSPRATPPSPESSKSSASPKPLESEKASPSSIITHPVKSTTSSKPSSSASALQPSNSLKSSESPKSTHSSQGTPSPQPSSSPKPARKSSTSPLGVVRKSVTSDFQQAFMKHLDQNYSNSDGSDGSDLDKTSKAPASKSANRMQPSQNVGVEAQVISESHSTNGCKSKETGNASCQSEVVPKDSEPSVKESKATTSKSTEASSHNKKEEKSGGSPVMTSSAVKPSNMSKTVSRPTGNEVKRKCLSDITFPKARPVNKVSNKSPTLSPVIPEGGLGKLSPPPHLKLTLPKYPLLSDRHARVKSPSNSASVSLKRSPSTVVDINQPLDFTKSNQSSSKTLNTTSSAVELKPSNERSPHLESTKQLGSAPVVLKQPRVAPTRSLSVSPTKNPLSLKFSLSPPQAGLVQPTRHKDPAKSYAEPLLQRQRSVPEARHQMLPQQPQRRPNEFPVALPRKSLEASKRPSPTCSIPAAAPTVKVERLSPQKTSVSASPNRLPTCQSDSMNSKDSHASVLTEDIKPSCDTKYLEVNHNSIQIVNDPGPQKPQQPPCQLKPQEVETSAPLLRKNGTEKSSSSLPNGGSATNNNSSAKSNRNAKDPKLPNGNGEVLSSGLPTKAPQSLPNGNSPTAQNGTKPSEEVSNGEEPRQASVSPTASVETQTDLSDMKTQCLSVPHTKPLEAK